MPSPAVLLAPEHAKLQRLFVRPEYRGQGAAKSLVDFLETGPGPRARLFHARDRRAPAQLGLYRVLGYAPRGPLDRYLPDPLSGVFMQKRAT